MQRKKNIRSQDLGIALASGQDRELFRWFLACLLFGKRIQQEIARNAFLELDQAGLDSPEAVVNAGWDRLVELLDQAHYVRYDFSTASTLINVCETLRARHGTVNRMIARSATPRALAATLQEFKGIGPVTARIFVDEIRPIWNLLRLERAGGGSEVEERSAFSKVIVGSKKRQRAREAVAMTNGAKKLLGMRPKGPEVTALSSSQPHSKSYR